MKSITQSQLTKTALFGALCAMALIGCKQDPYTAISGTPGQKVVTENPGNNQQAPKIFSIEAPDTIDCTETVKCGTEIKGHVPAPGNAIVRISGMPADSTYDAATGVFEYTAGFKVVDVSAHPEQSIVTIPLNVSVRSSADSVTETSRVVTVVVKNKMQPVTYKSSGVKRVEEGSTLEQVIDVSSVDFPQGPFALSVLNAPVGTEVISSTSNPNQFRVRYTPNYVFVQNAREKEVKVTYSLGLPIGQPVTQAETWTMVDIRQAPAIAAPETLTQGLDVSFAIRAEDLNGEQAPVINVSPNVPFGRISFVTALETQASSVTIPTKVVNVRWDRLKVENLGTTTPISYEVCVKRVGTANNCVQKQVKVTLQSDLHPAPLLDRSLWKAGDLKFFRIGSAMSFKMPIVDAEDKSAPVDVKINATQEKVVSWKAGVLTIEPKVEGILQFNVIAQSVYGQVTNESFVVEVFPAAWAKTMMFTNNAIQNESVESTKLIPSADLLNVNFQVSSRNLALRESAFITTEALSTPGFEARLQDSVYQQVLHTVVSSPLAEKLTGKIAAELQAFGVKIVGRFDKVAPSTRVDVVSLIESPKSNLQHPNAPGGLKGLLTKESANPLVFDASGSSKCMPLFNLQKPALSVTVGVTCKGSDGRTLTVLGFELADVALDPKENDILKNWTAAMLTGKAY